MNCKFLFIWILTCLVINNIIYKQDYAKLVFIENVIENKIHNKDYHKAIEKVLNKDSCSDYVYTFNDNYLDYCEKVNNAELNIILENFAEATTYYDSAFNLVDSPLAKDIHNAIISSKKVLDNNKIKKYLYLMIEKKSLDPKYYKKEHFDKYLSKEDRIKIKNKYNAKINNGDYIFIKSMIKKDQSIRKRKNYYHNRQLIREVDSLNFEKYKNYFSKRDYPGEEIMLNFPCSQSKDYILFYHWFQNKYDIIPLAEKLVEDLKYLNIDFAYQYEVMKGSMFYNSFYGLVLCKKFKGKITLIQITPEQEIIINKNRAKIGLEKLDDYKKKLEYFKKHNEYCYKKSYYLVLLG